MSEESKKGLSFESWHRDSLSSWLGESDVDWLGIDGRYWVLWAESKGVMPPVSSENRRLAYWEFVGFSLGLDEAERRIESLPQIKRAYPRGDLMRVALLEEETGWILSKLKNPDYQWTSEDRDGLTGRLVGACLASGDVGPVERLVINNSNLSWGANVWERMSTNLHMMIYKQAETEGIGDIQVFEGWVRSKFRGIKTAGDYIKACVGLLVLSQNHINLWENYGDEYLYLKKSVGVVAEKWSTNPSAVSVIYSCMVSMANEFEPNDEKGSVEFFGKHAYREFCRVDPGEITDVLGAANILLNEARKLGGNDAVMDLLKKLNTMKKFENYQGWFCGKTAHVLAKCAQSTEDLGTVDSYLSSISNLDYRREWSAHVATELFGNPKIKVELSYGYLQRAFEWGLDFDGASLSEVIEGLVKACYRTGDWSVLERFLNSGIDDAVKLETYWQTNKLVKFD